MVNGKYTYNDRKAKCHTNKDIDGLEHIKFQNTLIKELHNEI